MYVSQQIYPNNTVWASVGPAVVYIFSACCYKCAATDTSKVYVYISYSIQLFLRTNTSSDPKTDESTGWQRCGACIKHMYIIEHGWDWSHSDFSHTILKAAPPSSSPRQMDGSLLRTVPTLSIAASHNIQSYTKFMRCAHKPIERLGNGTLGCPFQFVVQPSAHPPPRSTTLCNQLYAGFWRTHYGICFSRCQTPLYSSRAFVPFGSIGTQFETHTHMYWNIMLCQSSRLCLFTNGPIDGTRLCL